MAIHKTVQHGLGLLIFTLFAACAGNEESRDSDFELEEQQQELRNSPQAFMTVGLNGIPTGFSSTVAGAGAVGVPDGVVGTYTVDINGLAPALPLGPGMNGTVQVTAVGQGPARCTLTGSWLNVGAAVRVFVTCRLPGGALVDSGFSLYYGRGQGSIGDAAYVRASAAGIIEPVSSFNSMGLANGVLLVGPGQYDVRLPGAPGLHSAALQVTALSATSHCHPAQRTFAAGAERIRVLCFNNAGLLANTPFTLNLASRTSTALIGRGAFTEVSAAGVPNPAQSHSVCADSPPAVTFTPQGIYDVHFTKLVANPRAIFTTALGFSSAHCKLEWVQPPLLDGTVRPRVSCFGPTGLRVNQSFIETLVARNAACLAL